MNYNAVIKVKESPADIQKILSPEKISRERSKVDIKKDGEELIIEVMAKDAVALRASLNTITQLLAVYHKTKKI